MHLVTWGANWRSLGAIKVHFRPHLTVLRRNFTESCSGNHVRGPCLGAATECSCVRSVPANGTPFLEPYNMQLWEELLQINGFTLRLMHYQKDIRANYAICLCGQ